MLSQEPNVITHKTRPEQLTVEAQTRKINLLKAKVISNYANVCRLACIKEEVVLNFGVCDDWGFGIQDVNVDLRNRLILNPILAKKLARVLDDVLTRYELHYGELQIQQKQRLTADTTNMTRH